MGTNFAWDSEARTNDMILKVKKSYWAPT
jgi:hypothetical protein